MGTLFQGVDSMGHCPWDVPGMGTETFQGSELRIAGHTVPELAVAGHTIPEMGTLSLGCSWDGNRKVPTFRA